MNMQDALERCLKLVYQNPLTYKQYNLLAEYCKQLNKVEYQTSNLQKLLIHICLSIGNKLDQNTYLDRDTAKSFFAVFLKHMTLSLNKRVRNTVILMMSRHVLDQQNILKLPNYSLFIALKGNDYQAAYAICHMAVQTNCKSILLYRDRYKRNCLHLSAQRDYVDIYNILLKHCPELALSYDKQGNTPAKIAIGENSFRVIQENIHHHNTFENYLLTIPAIFNGIDEKKGVSALIKWFKTNKYAPCHSRLFLMLKEVLYHHDQQTLSQKSFNQIISVLKTYNPLAAQYLFWRKSEAQCSKKLLYEQDHTICLNLNSDNLPVWIKLYNQAQMNEINTLLHTLTKQPDKVLKEEIERKDIQYQLPRMNPITTCFNRYNDKIKCDTLKFDTNNLKKSFTSFCDAQTNPDNKQDWLTNHLMLNKLICYLTTEKYTTSILLQWMMILFKDKYCISHHNIYAQNDQINQQKLNYKLDCYPNKFSFSGFIPFNLLDLSTEKNTNILATFRLTVKHIQGAIHIEFGYQVYCSKDILLCSKENTHLYGKKLTQYSKTPHYDPPNPLIGKEVILHSEACFLNQALIEFNKAMVSKRCSNPHILQHLLPMSTPFQAFKLKYGGKIKHKPYRKTTLQNLLPNHIAAQTRAAIALTVQKHLNTVDIIELIEAFHFFTEVNNKKIHKIPMPIINNELNKKISQLIKKLLIPSIHEICFAKLFDANGDLNQTAKLGTRTKSLLEQPHIKYILLTTLVFYYKDVFWNYLKTLGLTDSCLIEYFCFVKPCLNLPLHETQILASKIKSLSLDTCLYTSSFNLHAYLGLPEQHGQDILKTLIGYLKKVVTETLLSPLKKYCLVMPKELVNIIHQLEQSLTHAGQYADVNSQFKYTQNIIKHLDICLIYLQINTSKHDKSLYGQLLVSTNKLTSISLPRDTKELFLGGLELFAHTEKKIKECQYMLDNLCWIKTKTPSESEHRFIPLFRNLLVALTSPLPYQFDLPVFSMHKAHTTDCLDILIQWRLLASNTIKHLKKIAPHYKDAEDKGLIQAWEAHRINLKVPGKILNIMQSITHKIGFCCPLNVQFKRSIDICNNMINNPDVYKFRVRQECKKLIRELKTHCRTIDDLFNLKQQAEN